MSRFPMWHSFVRLSRCPSLSIHRWASSRRRSWVECSKDSWIIGYYCDCDSELSAPSIDNIFAFVNCNVSYLSLVRRTPVSWYATAIADSVSCSVNLRHLNFLVVRIIQIALRMRKCFFSWLLIKYFVRDSDVKHEEALILINQSITAAR